MAGRRRGRKNKFQQLEEGPSVALEPSTKAKPIPVAVESSLKSSQQGPGLPSPPSAQAKKTLPPFPRVPRNSRFKPSGDEGWKAGPDSNVAERVKSERGSEFQRRASRRPTQPPQHDRTSLRDPTYADKHTGHDIDGCELENRKIHLVQMAAATVVLVCAALGMMRFSGSKELVAKIDSALKNVTSIHAAVNQTKEKQSETETRLESMENALDSMAKRYGLFEEKVSQKGGEESVNWFRNRVEEIMEARLDTLTADTTGLPDYALATAGASIVGHSVLLRGFHFCSFGGSFPLWTCFIEFYMQASRILGFSTQMVHPLADELILQPGAIPGRCLPLAGSSGYIDVRLRNPVLITAITLEHTHKRVAYEGQWRSAVHEFQVWGFNHTRKGKRTVVQRDEELGRYTFKKDGRHVQTFNVVNPQLVVDHLRLKVISNHGLEDYTCIYRIRVHGAT